MSSTWVDEKERGSGFLILLIRWIALNMGRGPARFFLYPITAYFMVRARSSVKGSKDFLRRTAILSPSSWNVARHIHCFASTILDRVFFLTGQFERYEINVHNIDVIYDNITDTQGCLLMGSHHGSFEVLRSLNYKKHKIPLKVLMYSEHNALITRIMESLNPNIRDSVIPLGQPDTMIKAMEAFQQGQIIGILGDRASDSDKHVYCTFFGETIKIPTGPFQLAMALKAPIVQFFGIYRGGNRYDIYFELLTVSADFPRSERQQATQQMAQKYVDILQSRVQDSPLNWFNFYQYWGD